MGDRRVPKSTLRRDDSDDWETDPDFIRDMDEIDQRWGAKRSIGSINMSKLIDEVHRDHEISREKFAHPSQSLRNKLDVVKDRDFDYKRTSKEVSSREIITSTSSSIMSSGRNGGIPSNYEDSKRSVFSEKNQRETKSPSPQNYQHESTTKPYYATSAKQATTTTTASAVNSSKARSPVQLDNPSSSSSTGSTRETVREVPVKSPNYQSVSPIGASRNIAEKNVEISSAFKSIQAKIDAFKRDFEDIESKIAKKTESSKVAATKAYTTSGDDNTGIRSNIESVDLPRSSASRPSSDHRQASPTSDTRQAQGSPLAPKSSPSPTAYTSRHQQVPKAPTNIKSLSERFETLCRDDGTDFRRRTEERRKEFFNEIKNQVRETRRDLDGFDTVDDDEPYDDLDRRMKDKIERLASSNLRRSTSNMPKAEWPSKATAAPTTSTKQPAPSYASSSQRRVESPSSNSLFSKPDRRASSPTPKVYTTRETVREEVISKIVKENDKVIKNDTERNVERSSSHHGSSADEADDHFEPRAATKNKIVYPETAKASTGGLMARTLYDYQAASSDELTFDVDDLITNIEKIDVGWYKGTISHKDGTRQLGQHEFYQLLG